MLKRIKIRGKLLLLLAVPTVAVLIFAATGVLDRIDRSEFLEREARIASLADAGSDLSLAVQVQRTRGLAVEAGADVDVAEAGAATSAAIQRWLAAADAVSGDITEDDVAAQIDGIAANLKSLDEGVDEMSPTTISAELSIASRQVTALTPRLLDQPAELTLFRALGDHLRVTQIQNAVGEITALGASSIEQGSVPPVTSTLLDAADLQVASGIDQLLTTSHEEYSEMVLALQGDGLLPDARHSSVSDIEFIIDSGSDTALVDWLLEGEERLSGVNAVSDAVLEDASSAAAEAATTAQDEANSFMILAGSVVVAALVMALLVGRSISRPLTKLTRSADQLSAEELPALVESLRSGGRTELPELTTIEVKGRDEVAKLAGAISEIQQVTIDVAEEQGDLLRRGISDIFVNLARRNQSLLDRQIDFIDQLEAREENPDQLENLFRLDHLATRMRRNAESLLVLAGQEPTRRRGQPVEVADAVRVAMGEIEDYSRIRLNTIDGATVAGSVAVDLAHLLSELMENATQFSPPEAGVEVIGHRCGDGSYQLTLADRGIGMSAEAIIASNRTLAEPPIVGLDLSRSLGFTVVSRLAHRLGVTVELSSSAQGGVTATVTVPADMVGDTAPTETTPTATSASTPSSSLAAPAPPEAVPAEPAAESPFDRPVESAPPPPPPIAADAIIETPDAPTLKPAPFAPTDEEPVPSPVPTATGPDRGPSEAPPTALPRRTRPGPPTEQPASAAEAAGGDMFDVFGAAPTPIAPTRADADIFAPLDATAAPLPKRVPTTEPTVAAPTDPSPFTPADAPQVAHAASPFAPPAQPASLAPTPSEPSDVPPELPTRRASEVGAVDPSMTEAGLIRRTPRQVPVPGDVGVSADPAQPPTPQATRSPEEVREMLSRYRSGLRKGRTADRTDHDQSNED